MKIMMRILVLLSACCFMSCESWLNLKPSDAATEDEIFSTGDGYRTVLNGLYKKMGSSSLYGRELSFGFVDCLSQQYDMTEENMSSELYRAAAAFQYDQVDLSKVIDNIWLTAFNVIANANNLIQNVEKTDPDFFQQGEIEQQVILGEAYACRALMHFDLLRLFAPAPVTNDAGNYVPYVERYPNIQANGIAVKPFLEKVIRDLERGRQLVAIFDTTALGLNTMCDPKGRFYNEYPGNTPLGDPKASMDDFFKGRGYRLNYYSMTALLARVYQYAGNYAMAKTCAEEIIHLNYDRGILCFDSYNDYDYYGLGPTTAWDNKAGLRLLNSLVFAVYNERAYDELGLGIYFRKELGGDKPNYFVINSKQHIFNSSSDMDETNDDMRSSMLVMNVGGGVYSISGKWYASANEEIRKNNVTILPVIRVTEMYYIAAESYARENNFPEAENLLSTVRMNRGCWDPAYCSDWESFVNELIIDARREWISEGQLFYLYKRLNAAIDFGDQTNRVLKNEEAVVPIPQDQR